MSENLGVFTSYDKFKRYSEEDVEYKDEARKLLCDSLGFEPPIHLSMTSELTLRQNLRNVSSGKIKKDVLQKSVDFHTSLVKKLIS